MALLCFLITCSAEDVWNEEEIQNRTKKQKKNKQKRDQTKHRAAGKCIVNVPFLYFLYFLFSKMRENVL